MTSDGVASGRVPTYECVACGARRRSAYEPTTCEDCGGNLRDLIRAKE